MNHRFLLDTNVISETRKIRPNAGVAAFFDATPESALFLSVLTMGELRRGAAMCRNSRPSFASQLSIWIDEIAQRFEDRIIPIDLRIASVWGDLAANRTQPVVDSLLAATAACHDLTLVTRNTVDVRGAGARILNPFA